jgi:eukaryotic-like serine/threonine-protein kinase
VDALQLSDPQRVGKYRLLNRLGTGGMGRVFLGQSPSGRLVAVKLIRPDLADNPDFRQRFAQEVTAARRVSGIFTATVVDADPDGPQPWLVTEFVAGPSLAEAISGNGAMPVESVRMLARGLAEGLGAVHAAGIVHRDLKPSNVLLAADGPRIIDFGISRAADSTWLTSTGGVLGSPGFMSPEQAEGKYIGKPTDIFSLGSLLTFAATGEPPFGTGTASALLYRVVYGAAATGHVPPELRPLIERCMAKDPATRPTTEELLAELGAAEPAGSWPLWAADADGRRPAATRRVPAGSDDPGPVHGPPDDQAPVLTGVGAGSHVPWKYLDQATAVDYLQPLGPTRPQPKPGVVGLAVAAVLAVIAASAVAIVTLLSHHHQTSPPSGSARKTQLSTAGRSVEMGPGAVVEAYYAAVNTRDWRRAWRLGGEYLSPSFRSMVDGYRATDKDVISSIRVARSTVVVRIRAYEVGGALQVYRMIYLVSNGTIVDGSETLLTPAPSP